MQLKSLLFHSVAIATLMGSSHSLMAKDIKQIFLELSHKRFQESLRPLLYSVPYDARSQKAKITSKDIRQVFETYFSTGTVDTQNHFIQFKRNGAMGAFERTYVIYFTTEEAPILVGSEKNTSMADNYTGLFALCQRSNGDWQECTNSVFPAITLTDFLKPGSTLGSSAKKMFDIYYELPRYGTKITGEIVCDDYAYVNGKDWPVAEAYESIKREKSNFQTLKFYLIWDKTKQRFTIQP